MAGAQSQQASGPRAPGTLKAVEANASQDGSAERLTPAELTSESAPVAIWEAAFRGLLDQGDELKAIETGLAAPAVHVKNLALDVLGKGLKRGRQDHSKSPSPDSLHLLQQALSDPVASVRFQAARMTTELKVGADEEQTLRLLLQSTFPDVRGKVLEVMTGREHETWSHRLLLELLDDPDAELRMEAFARASRRGKNRGIQHLAWALSGSHAGLKILALTELRGRQGNAVRRLFNQALKDTDEGVRQAAIAGLESLDARVDLAGAVRSSMPGVRLLAAAALARFGDHAALAPLLETVQRAIHDSTYTAPIDDITVAIRGLAELGDPRAHKPVCDLLEHPDTKVRTEAERALPWVCNTDDPLLSLATSRLDDTDQDESSFGLALLGDTRGLPAIALLRQKEAPEALMGVCGAAALSHASPSTLVEFLRHPEPRVRRNAFRICLLGEAAKGTSPEWMASALRSTDSFIRLSTARAAGHYPNRDEFRRFVHEALAEQEVRRSGFDVETVCALGALVSHGQPRLRARTARLLQLLDSTEDFGREYRRFTTRFHNEIEEAKSLCARDEGTELHQAQESISALASGQRQTLLPLPEGGSGQEGSKLVATRRALSVLKHCLEPMAVLASRDPEPIVQFAAAQSLAMLGMDVSRLPSAAKPPPDVLRLPPASVQAKLANLLPVNEDSQALSVIQARTPEKSGMFETPGDNREGIQVDGSGRAMPLGSAAEKQMKSKTGVYTMLPTPKDFVWLRRAPEDSSAQPTRALRISGQITSRAGICDIIAFIGQTNWQGELVISHKESTRSIFFDAGHIVAAATNVQDERIGNVMYRLGAVQSSDLIAIEQKARQGMRFGWAAVDLGLITKDKLFQMMGEQIRTILFATFAFSEGTFFFFDGLNEELSSHHAFSISTLLLDGLTQLDEMELFRRKIPSSDYVPVSTGRSGPVAEPFREIYATIDGVTSIKDIARLVGSTEFGALKAVHELMQAKRVEVQAPRTEGGARAFVQTANVALQMIHDRVSSAGRGDKFHRTIKELWMHSSCHDMFNDIQPEDDGTLQMEALIAGCPPENELELEALLKQALHEYVNTLLFASEGDIGQRACHDLTAELKEYLAILRPQDDSVLSSAFPQPNSRR